MNFTGSAHLLQQHAKHILVIQHFLCIIHNHFKTKGFGTRTYHVEGLWVNIGGDEEAVRPFQFADAFCHRHCFGGGGGFIQQRGGGDVQTGQIQRHLLEVQQCFQTALRHFRLIRGVRGVPARVFQHVAQNNRRQLHVGVAHANVRLKALVQAGNGLQFCQRGKFSRGFTHLRRGGELNILWHDLRNQCV